MLRRLRDVRGRRMPVRVRDLLVPIKLLIIGSIAVASIAASSPGLQPVAEKATGPLDGQPKVSGDWVEAEGLNEPRARHTATLLPNGKLLVAGGCTAWDVRPAGRCTTISSSAELYDPASGRWSRTAPMKNERSGHTATLLPTGKVLVAGGCSEVIQAGGSGGLWDCRSATSSSELYDPATGRWSQTGSMKVGRTEFAAALVPSVPRSECAETCGDVLVVGNSPGPGAFGATEPELYDGDSGEWSKVTKTPGLAAPGDCCAPVLTPLESGLMLLTSTTSPAALFDPAQREWTPIAQKERIRGLLSSATVLKNGKVLKAGGLSASGDAASSLAEIYDPAGTSDLTQAGGSGTWTATADMGIARRAHRAVRLASGDVLVIGGAGPDERSFAAVQGRAEPVTDAPTFNSSTEVYRVQSGDWTAAGSMSTGRGDTLNDRPAGADFTATRLGDGRVLVAGGAVPVSWNKSLPPSQQAKKSLDEVEVYVPDGLTVGDGRAGSLPQGSDGNLLGRGRNSFWLLFAGITILAALFVVVVRSLRSRKQ